MMVKCRLRSLYRSRIKRAALHCLVKKLWRWMWKNICSIKMEFRPECGPLLYWLLTLWKD